MIHIKLQNISKLFLGLLFFTGSLSLYGMEAENDEREYIETMFSGRTYRIDKNRLEQSIFYAATFHVSRYVQTQVEDEKEENKIYHLLNQNLNSIKRASLYYIGLCKYLTEEIKNEFAVEWYSKHLHEVYKAEFERKDPENALEIVKMVRPLIDVLEKHGYKGINLYRLSNIGPDIKLSDEDADNYFLSKEIVSLQDSSRLLDTILHGAKFDPENSKS